MFNISSLLYSIITANNIWLDKLLLYPSLHLFHYISVSCKTSYSLICSSHVALLSTPIQIVHLSFNPQNCKTIASLKLNSINYCTIFNYYNSCSDKNSEINFVKVCSFSLFSAEILLWSSRTENNINLKIVPVSSVLHGKECMVIND